MTEKDKEILLKDLCARLPYETMFYSNSNGDECLLSVDLEYCKINELYTIEQIKPYLRPMSSMTEEEERELRILWNEDLIGERSPFYIYPCYSKTLDFYNSNHFDYRGLIERGLAIRVTEENNPYKE